MLNNSKLDSNVTLVQSFIPSYIKMFQATKIYRESCIDNIKKHDIHMIIQWEKYNYYTNVTIDIRGSET